jgi:hypothetical protein
VRFTDFLKATVLLSAAAATALAVVAVASATTNGNTRAVLVGIAWWVIASLIGTLSGRRAETTPPIARLLATARSERALPEIHPGRVLLNRLWPLLLSTVAAIALAFVVPQVPAIACGFAIIWALAWRRQDSAVTAIEERDGVRFYVERTAPWRPMRLVRTPGFKGGLSGSWHPTG